MEFYEIVEGIRKELNEYIGKLEDLSLKVSNFKKYGVPEGAIEEIKAYLEEGIKKFKKLGKDPDVILNPRVVELIGKAFEGHPSFVKYGIGRIIEEIKKGSKDYDLNKFLEELHEYLSQQPTQRICTPRQDIPQAIMNAVVEIRDKSETATKEAIREKLREYRIEISEERLKREIDQLIEKKKLGEMKKSKYGRTSYIPLPRPGKRDIQKAIEELREEGKLSPRNLKEKLRDDGYPVSLKDANQILYLWRKERIETPEEIIGRAIKAAEELVNDEKKDKVLIKVDKMEERPCDIEKKIKKKLKEYFPEEILSVSILKGKEENREGKTFYNNIHFIIRKR